MFSSRLPRLDPNAFSLALARRRAAGGTTELLDLTETNPTRVALPYPPDLLSPLADAGGAAYDPAPLGLASARAAAAAEYARQGIEADPDRIAITAGTSEAYGLLFKLLCDPGDAVLVPQPSYPLFELLASLDGVRMRPYRLDWHGRWSIDRASLEAAFDDSVRAVLVVSPNNPTGSLVRRADRDWLAGLAAGRRVAIISDEVFADYTLAPAADGCCFAGETRALTFALGGLSKSAGLPQVKLGWLLASGPDDRVQEALSRLEIICDTYLTVSTPVQLAAPALVESGRLVREAIARRLAGNLTTLRDAVRAHPAVTLLEPEGGWSAVLRVPAAEPEEALVLRLLDEASVVVHPGYFFDFDGGAHLVISLLPESSRFAEAVARLLPVAAGEFA